jgi:hypothetical protein
MWRLIGKAKSLFRPQPHDQEKAADPTTAAAASVTQSSKATTGRHDSTSSADVEIVIETNGAAIHRVQVLCHTYGNCRCCCVLRVVSKTDSDI